MPFQKKLFSFLFFFQISLFSFNGFSQNLINEYSNFECSQSKQISFPLSEFSKSKGGSPSAINQVVFYEHRDQFSFWYRIVVNSDGLIDFGIDPINKDDSYVLYVYEYSKPDFCNKVFYGKKKPLKASKLDNEENRKAFELSNIKINAKKNDVFYFCVLSTSESNCGHFMRLLDGKDTLNVKAVNFPCTPEERELLVVKQDSVQKTTPKSCSFKEEVDYDTIVVNTLVESETRKKINAFLTIKEEWTGNEIPVVSLGKFSYSVIIEKGKNYNVECLATGYKNFDYSMIISEYVNPDSNVFDIYLKPLKAGDNFVMKNIYFYPNTYALRKDSEQELQYLLNYLINNPEVIVELQGHTNGNNRCKKNKAYRKKGPEWNFSGTAKKLSEYRSEAIKDYLVKNGVVKQNIETKGYGGDRMIIANPKTMEAIDKNIRVEVLILKGIGL